MENTLSLDELFDLVELIHDQLDLAFVMVKVLDDNDLEEGRDEELRGRIIKQIKDLSMQHYMLIKDVVKKIAPA